MLLRLHREIDSRTGEIASSHGDWPCRRGCDQCCRRLADLPRLTREEWLLLEEGLDRLTVSVRAGIAERIAAARQSGGGRTCPFLDQVTGSCLVYDCRPVACRTYGFYVERDRGLYCDIIESRVNAGDMADVVWGNAAAVESALEELGGRIALLDYFSDSPRWSLPPAPIPPSETPYPCAGTPASPTTPPSAPR